MNRIGIAVWTAFFGISACASAKAEEPHQHGAGHLNLAVDGKAVQMELIVPGASIVGFENAPVSAEEINAVRQAVDILDNGDQLFSFPPEAGCLMQMNVVEPDLGGNDGHNDLVATYGFACQRSDQLRYVDVNLFAHFPALEELDARALTATYQGAAELTPSSNRLKLTR